MGRALQIASRFMIAGGARAQAAGRSGCARRFGGFRGSCAALGRPPPPPYAGVGAASHFPRPDARSRGSPCPARPTPAAAFLGPERTFLGTGVNSAGLRDEEELPPPTWPSQARQPPEPGGPSSSLPKLLRRRQRRTLRRGEGPRPAALLTGSRPGPGVSATWRGPHALGDTRGAGAGARGGEGSQGRSFCLLSPQLPGLEKFSLRGKKKFLSAACCLILVNLLSHRGGISSEPRCVRESPDPRGGGV